MFEILQALMALDQACRDNGTVLNWTDLEFNGDSRWGARGVGVVCEITLNEEDIVVIQQMRQLVGVA